MKPRFIAAALWLGASALVWPRESGNKGAAGDAARSNTTARIAAKKTARVDRAEAGTLPTLENVAYGDHEKHRIDLWLVKSDKPAPLLAFFHGGGGDKTQYRGNKLLEFCLQNGISCAAVNYRENNQWPFPIPMNDAARVIQFLRHHAAEYNIDPKRIATWGTSLGANVTTWLGYHDDLAKADSQDPVERESTRLLFVITSAGQTFNDMQMFRERVYPYAIRGGTEEGGAEKGEPTKAHELSAIYHVTKDDPPIFMTYGIPLRPLPLPKDTPRGELIHNPAFGLLLKEKLDELGIENYLYHGGNKPPENAERDFILKHFFPNGTAPAPTRSTSSVAPRPSSAQSEPPDPQTRPSLAIAPEGLPTASPRGDGCVRVEQRDGVWWFVSPQGEPFVSIGVNHVAPELLLTPGNQEATLQRYGADFVTAQGAFNSAGEAAKRWMEEVFQDMRDWGFNTLGMHVGGSIDPALYRTRVYNLPSVRAARIEGMMRGNASQIPDVFSEAFAARVEATAKSVCAECAGNPLTLGYCYCDLPPWTDAQMLGGASGGGFCGPWGEALRSQPAQTAGKQAWIGLLREQYGSASEAARAYGLTASSWDDLAAASEWSHPRDEKAAARDGDAFTARIAERWYGLLHDAIRRYDADHLIFGDKLKYDRIPSLLAPILKKYVDVLLIQDSKETVDEQIKRFSDLYKQTGKPILSGDSGFGVQDSQRKQLKGFLVNSYAEAGEHYAACLKGIMGLPFVVGWHYCGYTEGCVGSRYEAQEGFKDAFGKPHEDALQHVRDATAKAVEWHRASRPWKGRMSNTGLDDARDPQ